MSSFLEGYAGVQRSNDSAKLEAADQIGVPRVSPGTHKNFDCDRLVCLVQGGVGSCRQSAANRDVVADVDVRVEHLLNPNALRCPACLAGLPPPAVFGVPILKQNAAFHSVRQARLAGGEDRGLGREHDGARHNCNVRQAHVYNWAAGPLQLTAYRALQQRAAREPSYEEDAVKVLQCRAALEPPKAADDFVDRRCEERHHQSRRKNDHELLVALNLVRRGLPCVVLLSQSLLDGEEAATRAGVG